MLAELSGQRTVPNLFISGKHVGGGLVFSVKNRSQETDSVSYFAGSSDLEAKNRSGELKKLLA